MPSLRSLSGSSDSDVNIRIATTADNKGVDEATSGLKKVGGEADTTGSKFSNMSTVAKVAIAAVGAAVLAAGKTFVQSAADLQQTSKSFEVLTGNVEVANALFAELATYANTTPFEFPDIAKAGQTLLGFGIQSDQVFSKIQILGDIAAATGANFSSLALVFGQVNATGKLMGQDALQLINNSIPIYNILAKEMGIETGKVKEQVEKGAVTIDIFNRALENVTKEGGFAFKGVDVLAQSFNGRMATLSDTVLEFGRNLIGVKVDDKLGLVVEEGGLFDRLSDLLPEISKGLEGITPQLTFLVGGLVSVAGALFDVAGQIAEALSPKMQELWRTMEENLIPTLEKLWVEVLEPLAGVLGGLLVASIGLTVDILNVLLPLITGFVNFMIDNKEFLAPIIGALVAFKAAMMLQDAFNAVTAMFTLFSNVTIPGAVAQFTAFKTLVATPIIMPAIAIGAALAAIATVWAKYNEMMTAIDGMQRSMDTSADATKDIQQAYYAARDSGDKAKADRLFKVYMNALDSDIKMYDDASKIRFFATGTRRAPEGVHVVGENGPELVDFGGGEKVYNANDSQRMVGGSSTSITIQQMILSTGEAVREFFEIQDNDQINVSMGLAPRRADG